MNHRDLMITTLGSDLAAGRTVGQCVDNLLSITPKARRSDPPTSHIGASAPQSGNRKLVLDTVRTFGQNGITADELAILHGHAKGLHRRLPELERMGYIERKGTRAGSSGVPNTIWIATPQTSGPVL